MKSIPDLSSIKNTFKTNTNNKPEEASYSSLVDKYTSDDDSFIEDSGFPELPFKPYAVYIADTNIINKSDLYVIIGACLNISLLFIAILPITTDNSIKLIFFLIDIILLQILILVIVHKSNNEITNFNSDFINDFKYFIVLNLFTILFSSHLKNFIINGLAINLVIMSIIATFIITWIAIKT